MILLDTSGLLAAIDSSQRHHLACAACLNSATPPLLLSPFVLAELDYLLGRYLGVDAQLALLAEVARGAYRLEPFDAHDISLSAEVAERYSSLGIGLADASLVVLAARHGASDVLTLDERHFRALRGNQGRPFRLLPADAPKPRRRRG